MIIFVLLIILIAFGGQLYFDFSEHASKLHTEWDIINYINTIEMAIICITGMYFNIPELLLSIPVLLQGLFGIYNLSLSIKKRKPHLYNWV